MIGGGVEVDRHPVGTGPFVWQWRQGDSLIFEANKEYHLGKLLWTESILKLFDRQIVLSQLKIGEIDIWNNIEFLNGCLAMNTGSIPIFLRVWSGASRLELDYPISVTNGQEKLYHWRWIGTIMQNRYWKELESRPFTDIHPLTKYFMRNGKPQPKFGSCPGFTDAVGEIWFRRILTKTVCALAFLSSCQKGRTSRSCRDMIARQLREVGVETKVQVSDPNLFFQWNLEKSKVWKAVYFCMGGKLGAGFLWLLAFQAYPSPENRYSGKKLCRYEIMRWTICLTSSPDSRPGGA